MKITFLIQDLFQQGAQYVTSLMATGFVNKGYDVDIIVSKIHQNLLDDGDIKPFDVPTSVNIVILNNTRARKNIFAIREYLKYGNCDVIIAMDPNYATALALASIGLKNRPKLSYVEHSGVAGLDRSNYEILKPDYFSLSWEFKRFILSRFDTLMAVSSGTANALERSMAFNEGSVYVVYNPVIDKNFLNKVQKKPRHPWIVEKDTPVVVAAGAHCALKNHRLLFQSIKKANESIPIKLVLFGKGDLTENYRKWIHNNGMDEIIDLPGHTDNLPSEIRNADAFIVSSNVESFSVVLIEALASGTPVISTRCRFGPPELLSNGAYGTLVPVGDSDTMADAIVAAVSKAKVTPSDESWQPYTLENVVNTYINALKL